MKRERNSPLHGYAVLWRMVLAPLGETQAEQGEALGVSPQAISHRRSRTRRRSWPVDRWSLAIAAAALMELEPERGRILARARALMAQADDEEEER